MNELNEKHLNEKSKIKTEMDLELKELRKNTGAEIEKLKEINEDQKSRLSEARMKIGDLEVTDK